MTIERQPKPELVSETRDAVKINAKKKAPYQEQIITSINLPGKERAENGIESTNSIKLAHEEPKKEISNAESIQILKKKEKPLLAPTETAAVEVKATKKQPPKFEISKTQPITAEAQTVETKESATEPQKPTLSIASKTAHMAFEKTALPKQEFSINEQSKLFVAPKKTEKTDANVGTEPSKLEISETKTLTAEAKKVEKQEIGTEMEASTPSVIAKEASFGYQTKNQPKPLLVQNNDNISLTGEKSFGELKGTLSKNRCTFPPNRNLKIGEQRETLLFEAQPKPESEISSVETFGILRQEKPENQIRSEVSVNVLPQPKALSYVIENQNDDGMTIEAKPKPEFVYENRDSIKIDAKGTEDYKKQIINTINLSGKEKADAVIGNTEAFVIEKQKKIPNTIQSNSEFGITGVKRSFENLEKGNSKLFVKGKEKVPLIPTEPVDITIEATKKQPPRLEISETQPIAAEAQTVETKESTTEPQKPTLSVVSRATDVSFEKTVLPKKEFVIGTQSKLFIAPKKTKKADVEVGTEQPEFEISETKSLIAEAKKIEKRDIGTDPQPSTLKIEKNEASLLYAPTTKPKPLSVHNESKVAFKGKKSFGKLEAVSAEPTDILAQPKKLLLSQSANEVTLEGKHTFDGLGFVNTETVSIVAQPKASLQPSETGKLTLSTLEKPENKKHSESQFAIIAKKKEPLNIEQRENLTVFPQPKAENQISTGETFNILRQENPENQVKHEAEVKVLSQPKALSYVIENQNDDGMTIEAKPKPELVQENRDSIKIDAKGTEDYKKQVINTIDLRGKERDPVKTESAGTFTIKKKIKEPNEIQSNSELKITGVKQPFGNLKEENGKLFVKGKEKAPLEISDTGTNRLKIDALDHPQNEVSGAGAFDILRQEKPENQVSRETNVGVLSRNRRRRNVKINGDSLSIKGNDANWRLQRVEATKATLETEEEASKLLGTELDFMKMLQQSKEAMRLCDIKPTKVISESVIRTKNTQNTEVQTADKVPLFMEKNELFIKGEKPSKNWIIDFDEDDFNVTDLPEAKKSKEKLEKKKDEIAKEREKSKQEWNKYFQSMQDQGSSVQNPFQKEQVLEEGTLAIKNESCESKQLRDIKQETTERIGAIKEPVLTSEISIQTDLKTEDMNVGTEDLPRTFDNDKMQRVHRVNESFVNDKLSLVSQLKQKEKEYEKLENEHAELGESAEEMLKINEECVSENKNLKSTEKNLKEEFVNLKKDYENLKKAFKELSEVEEKGCCDVSDEYKVKRALKGAKEIAAEAMEKITGGTLRGEEAAELLERFGEPAACFSEGVGRNHDSHKCENAVCRQRQRFMNSLAFLLQKMKNIPEAAPFKAIQAEQWMIEGSKTSKPFEVSPVNSVKLDVDPKVKDETEAQKEQLLKLMSENKELIAANEDLRSRLEEESGNKEALFDIIEKTKDDAESLEENNDLKEKSKAFEKEDNDLKAKVAELEKKNKDLEERLELKEKEFEFYADEVVGAIKKEFENKNAALEKNIEEKDVIIAQKDEELEKQKTNLFRKDEENTPLILQNLIEGPEGGADGWQKE